MIKNNLLWNRTIGFSGRLEKEPTFLGSVLIVAGGAVIASGALWLILWAAAAFQISSK